MMLWIVLTALTSIAAILVAVPFIRRFDRTARPDAGEIAVYRDQLAELNRERAHGQIDEATATSARTEIERRIVSAVESAGETGSDLSPRLKTIALAAVAGWVVVGSTILYAVTGSPDIASAPFRGTGGGVLASLDAPATPMQGQAQAAPQPTAGEVAMSTGNVDGMIAALAARLEENPDDADGWRMLGWSYFNTERYDDSAKAYARAAALQPERPDLHSAYGETLVRAAKGLVTPEAEAAFDKALALDPSDARARFFKGMVLEQAGRPDDAIGSWIALLKDTPPGADWEEGLRQRILELAAAESIDIAGRIPNSQGTVTAEPPEPGPTAEDVAAAQSMPEGDRQAMIRGMVDRLAQRLESDPNDPDGWVRLIRSRTVLGERDAAEEAFNRAQTVFADDPESLSVVTDGAAALGLTVE